MIAIRPLRDGDKNFIFSTYLKNNWHSKHNDTTLKKETWMRLQHGYIEQVFKVRPDQVKIASLEEDLDTILGYSIGDYKYIRPQWRNIAGLEEML